MPCPDPASQAWKREQGKIPLLAFLQLLMQARARQSKPVRVLCEGEKYATTTTTSSYASFTASTRPLALRWLQHFPKRETRAAKPNKGIRGVMASRSSHWIRASSFFRNTLCLLSCIFFTCTSISLNFSSYLLECRIISSPRRQTPSLPTGLRGGFCRFGGQAEDEDGNRVVRTSG